MHPMDTNADLNLVIMKHHLIKFCAQNVITYERMKTRMVLKLYTNRPLTFSHERVSQKNEFRPNYEQMSYFENGLITCITSDGTLSSNRPEKR